jgi:hypothetical protein
MTTVMGRKNTSTGMRVRPPNAKHTPHDSTSIGSAKTSIGRR